MERAFELNCVSTSEAIDLAFEIKKERISKAIHLLQVADCKRLIWNSDETMLNSSKKLKILVAQGK